MLLTMNSLNNITRFLSLLLIFIFVLAVTYFTTRFIAGYQKGRRQGSNIEIIETAKIAQDKYIQILKIGTRYIAVAISKNDVTFLANLEQEEITFPMQEQQKIPDFADVFSKIKKSKNPDETVSQPMSLREKMKKFEEDQSSGDESGK